jgi:glutamyl-tRNA synthetase
VAKRLAKPGARAVLEAMAGLFETVEAGRFTAAVLEPLVRGYCEERGDECPFSKAVHPVRVAVTGRAEGPGLFEILELLGRDRVLARLRAATAKCVD